MDENRLDKTIGIVAYVLDCLCALRDIQAIGDCNVCDSKKECPYVPKPGHMVRYNCPHFVRKD